MRTIPVSLVLALALAGCGRATNNSDVKLVGVGYSPDEIGPAPTPYGGIVEYNWFDFAGAGLSLGFAGLLSFDEIDNSGGFRPPYSLVYGFSYIFDNKLEGAVSAGTVQPLPPVEDVCYTTFEATGPIGSFTTTDVGTQMTFSSLESDASFSIGRVPADYPPDPENMFIYYSEISGWRPTAALGRVPGASADPLEMYDRALRPANFPFGEEVVLSFPGGVAKEHAPVGSLPLPSSYVGDPTVTLPHRLPGLRLAWNGPRYDATGATMADGEGQAACMAYSWPDGEPVPADAAGCAAAAPKYGGEDGQMYTGPWSTTDGSVQFQWDIPEGAEGEQVSLSIRLLGEVDREDYEYTGRYMVNKAPGGGDPRCGRDAQSCEEGEWVFNPDYLSVDWTDPLDASCGAEEYPLDDAPLITALQGDPMHTMAEVTCRLADDGEFALTNDIMERAYGYARQYGAAGAVFLFTRTNSVDATVPDVKDAYDHRRPISPIKVNARTIEVGRFWFDDFDAAGQSEE
ncbi:MAG: hypothetical protein ABIO70_03495 [Pseudomonadota bacterium]